MGISTKLRLLNRVLDFDGNVPRWGPACYAKDGGTEAEPDALKRMHAG